MDIFEKINRAFGSWYENLFGGGEDVRPKDILRRILTAMEDHRKEGFDNRVYVPNQYILEINVQDEEEKDYLLSFLAREELESAIRRYCKQNNYVIRGTLDFTIKEVEEGDPNSRRQEKIRVRCRYNTRINDPEAAEEPPRPASIAPAGAASHEERTVANVQEFLAGEESGTVPSIAPAALIVYAPDRSPFRYTIARGALQIGRSQRVGNDLVIESDGQISKRHARIELDPDGRFTIYDLGSTNGVKVNGRRVDNRTLNHGDEIILGMTRLLFQESHPDDQGSSDSSAKKAHTRGVFGGAAAPTGDQEPGSMPPPVRPLRAQTARLILMNGDEVVDDFLLASETTIGRAVTNDIVFQERAVATRHARIVHEGTGYTLECLENAETTLNGESLPPGLPTRLEDGDRIGIGSLKLRFDDGLKG
jgi:pSer/pThr/pTyr-binding forkhead associated (FHA) protein